MAVLVLVLVMAAGVAYGGWRLARAWRYRTALVEIRKQVQAGRHGVAARNLAEVLAWEPGSDEAAYLLGLCEKARGRIEAGGGSLVPGSTRLPVRPPGDRRPGRDAGRSGHFADAERLLTTALGDPRIDGFELRRFLTPLYWQEGRVAEARRLVEANWEVLNRSGRGGSHEAIELVRLHIAMGVGTASAESVQGFLDRAERLAPKDERIGLGRANLAIRQGAFDEAARWINACLRQLPEDVPTWRTRLEWAMATERVAEARAALDHLPAAESNPAEVHRLAAWFAARKGDVAAERRALLQLVEADPADGAAFDRLAELAVTGRPVCPSRRATAAEGGARSDQGPVPGALAPRPTAARRGQDGRPGGATGSLVRGQGLRHCGTREPNPPATTCGPRWPGCESRGKFAEGSGSTLAAAIGSALGEPLIAHACPAPTSRRYRKLRPITSGSRMIPPGPV